VLLEGVTLTLMVTLSVGDMEWEPLPLLLTLRV
jgi:hypothetical protein